MIWCEVLKGASWLRSEKRGGGGERQEVGERVDRCGCCGRRGGGDDHVFCEPYLYRHPLCRYSGSVSMAVVLDCC